MRAFLTARWAPLTAVFATVAYAVTVIGFGLNYRPLHYLAVHASLVLRDDMLGLRLPSALFGILAIALACGFGRELLGRSGGARWLRRWCCWWRWACAAAARLALAAPERDRA